MKSVLSSGYSSFLLLPVARLFAIGSLLSIIYLSSLPPGLVGSTALPFDRYYN